jgi:glutathione S-transferase
MDVMIITPVAVLSASVTILAACVCMFTGMLVGRMRAKHKIEPPAMTGAPEFERACRIQANTLEQFVVFLPLLWIATIFPFGIAYLAPAFGLVWIVGRVLYVRGYLAAAEKRSLGFNIGAAATMALLALALIGVVRAWVSMAASPS